MNNTIQGYWRAVRFSKFSLRHFPHTHLRANPDTAKEAPKAILGFHSRACLILAIGALLCAASHGATVPHREFAVPKLSEDGKRWICQTEVRNNSWYMRCDDLAAILGDDPVLKNNVELPASKLIPLYGAPFENSPLPLLAQSVLCGRDRTCSVAVAAW